MPHLLAAPDKYRGTATAIEIAEAMARGARRRGWTVRAQPLSDGGDGLLEVFAGSGLRSCRDRVRGPLGDPVGAEWRTDGRLAVIEMARASGLVTIGGPAHNDALAATSVGTGELIVAAARAVAPGGRIIVGLGGSATTDGGFEAATIVRDAGGLGGVKLIGACDVRVGFVDAARVFAPQKGASTTDVAVLEDRLEHVARRYLDEFGIDVRDVPGAGAAGGFGGAILAMGGELRSGYELVAEAVDLPSAIGDADLVMTGEGSLDAQSFLGKAVGSLVDDAARRRVPVVIVAGRASLDAVAESAARGVTAISLLDRFGRSAAMADPESCVEEVVGEVLGARGRTSD